MPVPIAGPEPPEQVDLDRTLAGAHVEPQHLGAVVGPDQPLGEEVKRRLSGEGPIHAEQRSDRMRAKERDPRNIIATWGTLTAEVAPLVAPILLLVRTAAAADPEVADDLRQRGRRPYVIPVGGSGSVGALGYVDPTVVPLDVIVEFRWDYLFHLYLMDRRRDRHN